MASTTTNTKPKPKGSDKLVTLSSDQAKFLVEVIREGRLKLTFNQWDNVADNLNLWNARAAEAQFNDLMDTLKSIPKPKNKKKPQGRGDSSDEDVARPEWHRQAKKTQITKTQHGNFNLDGVDGDFEEAEKKMSVDELLLVERQE